MREILIKIPDEIYQSVIDGTYCGSLYKEIKNGTPLPEHHGRLGDLDALEEYFRNVRKELKASDYKNGIEFFVRDEMLLNVQQFIHLCDAIIEGSEA
jgi:hypothetical protein